MNNVNLARSYSNALELLNQNVPPVPIVTMLQRSVPDLPPDIPREVEPLRIWLNEQVKQNREAARVTGSARAYSPRLTNVDVAVDVSLNEDGTETWTRYRSGTVTIEVDLIDFIDSNGDLNEDDLEDYVRDQVNDQRWELAGELDENNADYGDSETTDVDLQEVDISNHMQYLRDLVEEYTVAQDDDDE